MKISVLGAGAWGTTLAVLLHYNGHQITLWEHKKSYSEILKKTRLNTKYLPEIKIPEEIKITHSLEESSTGNNLIILAVPAQFLRNVIRKIDFNNIKDTILTSVAKGIEKETLLRMSEMAKDVFPQIDNGQIGVLSGPSHAEEVSKQIPTATVVASKSHSTSKTIQAAFMNNYFRVYSSLDICGVELGGAFKNVIAIGAGIIDGAKFGDNTKAAIMTRGISEISRLGIVMGAQADTFAGLSGMGDLIVTCMSKHSRNRFVGEKIGQGMSLKKILKEMNAVAEGVETCKSVMLLGKKYGVETPITDEVHNILFNGKDPVKATNDLMTRDMKME